MQLAQIAVIASDRRERGNLAYASQQSSSFLRRQESRTRFRMRRGYGLEKLA